MAAARDEAIDAMNERDEQWVRDGALYGSDYFATLLDAIPNDVLARYVQERGAVIDVVIAGDDWRAYDLADTPDGRSGAEHPPTIALYRLATEDE